jgi:hypothetical protein
MAGNENFQVRPREAQDRTKIAAGSPLAVLGIIIEALRERFGPNGNLDIEWREDAQTTDILIEAGYSIETEARNMARALYVNRLNTAPQQIAIGDRVGVHLPDHLEGFTCIMESQMSIDCVSNNAGDSMILADIVQSFLIASRQIFEAMYGFHDFGLASMSQTLPFDHDRNKWSTTVSFVVQYQSRWSTVKIRPLLQSIGLRASGVPSGSLYESAAISSLQRTVVATEVRAPSNTSEGG